MTEPKMTLIRRGVSRVGRSMLTGNWYLIRPPYHVVEGGGIIAGRKDDVHPEDQEMLDALAQAHDLVKHSIVLDPSELAAHLGHSVEIAAEYAPEGDIGHESEITGIVLACNCDEELGRADANVDA